VRLSEPVTTFKDPMTPIWKPVSSKSCTSLLCTPYLALVSSTSLNYAPITLESSCNILCLSLARLKVILSSVERVTKRVAEFLPTGSPPLTPSNLSAIFATSHSGGANPREPRSRMYRTIFSSSVRVSLRLLAGVSRRNETPLARLERRWDLTLMLWQQPGGFGIGRYYKLRGQPQVSLRVGVITRYVVKT
jgi:hypothetical protein